MVDTVMIGRLGETEIAAVGLDHQYHSKHFYGSNIVHIIGVLRGGGDVRFSLLAEAFTMWCIGVPLAFIGAFVLHLSVEGVVALVMAEEVQSLLPSCLGWSQNSG